MFFRMQSFDDMHVVFRDEIHRKRYVVLSERPMLPTRYPDPDFMETLGLEASERYLFIQLQWEEYVDAMHVTYRNLTLEFLSSIIYEPYIGIDSQRGYINFRLFGMSTPSIIRSLLSYLVFSVALMLCLKSL